MPEDGLAARNMLRALEGRKLVQVDLELPHSRYGTLQGAWHRETTGQTGIPMVDMTSTVDMSLVGDAALVEESLVEEAVDVEAAFVENAVHLQEQA
jgi:hypothetical protein